MTMTPIQITGAFLLHGSIGAARRSHAVYSRRWTPCSIPHETSSGMSYDGHRRSVEVVKYAAVEKSCAPLGPSQ